MHILPWTNPLVGTAFMLRARRGNLLANASLYVVVLIVAMVGWQYYLSLNPAVKLHPHKTFLLMLFGGQCFISGILMMGQAGGGLKNEVMNKTLDFQRIAATGPWDILLGKLLGLPWMAYVLALSAIPVAVFTLLNGVPGVTILDLLLLWMQILTFLFLLGSCCIQNTLQATSSKSTGASPGFGIFMGVMGVIIYGSFAGGDSSSYLSDPRRMTLGALLSPLTGYAGIAVEDPWAARFYWFSVPIPCIIFTPIAHLVIAWFALSIMARRLENTESTPLGKGKSYLMLVLADLVMAGVLSSCNRAGPPLGVAGFTLQQQIGLFLLLHGLLSVVYFIALTPRADQVMTWIWRFRTKQPLVDALYMDGAPNTVAILVNFIIAACGISLIYLFRGDNVANVPFLLESTMIVSMIILFIALLFQAFQLVSRKYGSAYIILFLFIVCLMPVVLGGIMVQSQLLDYKFVGKMLLQASPFSQILQWIVPDGDKKLYEIDPCPVIIGYSALSALALLYTWRWVQRRTENVEATKVRLLAT